MRQGTSTSPATRRFVPGWSALWVHPRSARPRGKITPLWRVRCPGKKLRNSLVASGVHPKNRILTMWPIGFFTSRMGYNFWATAGVYSRKLSIVYWGLTLENMFSHWKWCCTITHGCFLSRNVIKIEIVLWGINGRLEPQNVTQAPTMISLNRLLWGLTRQLFHEKILLVWQFNAIVYFLICYLIEDHHYIPILSAFVVGSIPKSCEVWLKLGKFWNLFCLNV